MTEILPTAASQPRLCLRLTEAGAGPRRLLHVFPTFNVGGAQVRFAALAAGLGARFHHTVMALNGGYEAQALLSPDAPVRLDGAPPAAPDLARRLRDYRRLLDEFKPDLLLTYNWGAIELALANIVGRTPHLHIEDGFGPEETTHQLRRRVWTRRFALARSQVVVPSVTLQTIATQAWGLDPRRVHYIPNGIPPKLHPATLLEDLVPDLPAGAPRIVWAGALRPEKNPLRLLRAFAPLKDQAVLLIIGSGPEGPALQTEAARLGLGRRVRFLGRRADARDIIMQCHVLALSSDTEQMPLVVLEAMDAALPVVACDVGDIRRMVAPENRPFLTPPDDAALGRALAALVNEAGLRFVIGQANRRRQRAVYALPPMIEAYGALFERLTAAGRARRAHA
jgi:glycosyltransferase involved in cell wall biosynthesis